MNKHARWKVLAVATGVCLAAGDLPASALAAIAVAPAASAATVSTSEWHYQSKKDDMRGTVSRGAFVESNSVSPGGFYNEDTRLHLVLHKEGNQTDAYIHVLPHGQLWCQYEACTVTVKFDGERPSAWSMLHAEAGNADTLFFSRSAAFIAKLKKSQSVIVEVTFYDQGRFQFKFPTSGLKW